MLRLLFLLAFCSDIITSACNPGYTDVGNGICRSALRGPTTRYQAYADCAAENAYMSTINNAFENANLGNLVQTWLWLGLTCTSSQTTSCLWDNGVAITNSSYTNFQPGSPNAAAGACIATYTGPGQSSGQWYSVSCGRGAVPHATSSYTAYYFCQTSPDIYVPKCPAPSYYFRGHCYYSHNAIGYNEAAVACSANCGHIASIHNDGENSFVRDIALSTDYSISYAFIGLTSINGSYRWNDGTQWNYNNFGYNDTKLGNCVIMATQDGDIVPQTKWMSTDCTEDTVTVCKTPLTCVLPTQTPLKCNGTQYLSGGGDILSPGYPLGSEANHCQYVISDNPNVTVVFTVRELSLDRNSTLKMYNSPLDTVPFVTFNSTSKISNATAYFAADNFLRIVFDTLGNPDFKNLWRLQYGVHGNAVGHCGSTFSTSPEVISGTHSAQNCTYLLKMGVVTERTCLRFSSVDVRKGDSIAIYDGPVNPQNQIAFISSVRAETLTYYTDLALCTTTSNYMTVITTGHSGLNYEMFVLTAADSPAVLNTQIVYTTYVNVPVPCIDHRYFNDTYRDFSVRYSASQATQKVKATFDYYSMPDPNFTAIIDGDNDVSVALAYGSLINSRMIYQSSGQFLRVVLLFREEDTPIPGYRATFTAV